MKIIKNSVIVEMKSKKSQLTEDLWYDWWCFPDDCLCSQLFLLSSSFWLYFDCALSLSSRSPIVTACRGSAGRYSPAWPRSAARAGVWANHHYTSPVTINIVLLRYSDKWLKRTYPCWALNQAGSQIHLYFWSSWFDLVNLGWPLLHWNLKPTLSLFKRLYNLSQSYLVEKTVVVEYKSCWKIVL